MQSVADLVVKVDAARRRLTLQFGMSTDGAAYRRAMSGWLESSPEAVGFDWLYDLRRYGGSVHHDDVTAFAATYEQVAQGRDEGARSVFVSPDSGFRLWVQACALRFPRRIFAVVETLAEAERELAKGRQRPG